MFLLVSSSMRRPREGERLTSGLAESVESGVADVLPKPLPSVFLRVEREVREEDRRLHFRVAFADHVEKVQRFGFCPELSANFVNDEEVDFREALDCFGLGLGALLSPGRADFGDKGAGLDEERGSAGLVGTPSNCAGKVCFPCPAPTEENQRIAVVKPGIDVAAEVGDGPLNGNLLGRLGHVAVDGRLCVSARDCDASVGLFRFEGGSTGRTGVEENEVVGTRSPPEWVAAVIRAGEPLGNRIAVLDAELFALLGRRIRDCGGYSTVRGLGSSRFRTGAAGSLIAGERAEFFHNFFLQKRLRRGTPNRARCT